MLTRKIVIVMLHIYYGIDKNNLDFEKVNLLSKISFKQINFDRNHDNISDFVLQETLFQDKMEYVITNASFLNCNNDKDNNLINTLNKVDSKIYCFVSDDKINTKLPNAQYHKIAKFNNLSKQKLITDLLSEYDIKFESILTRNYFESLIDNEPFLIKSELEKLLLSARDKIITKEQVEKVTSATFNTNFFKLTQLLLSKNKKELIKLYDNLISIKFQPMELLSMISSQLLYLKIYKLARQDHWSTNDIVTNFSFNQYTLMSYDNLDVSLLTVNKLIEELWTLEYNMKHNNINQYLGLKFFLLK